MFQLSGIAIGLWGVKGFGVWGFGAEGFWFRVLGYGLYLDVLSTDSVSGLLSNQGEKSINFYFIMVPSRKKYYSMVLQSPGLLSFPKNKIITSTTHLPHFRYYVKELPSIPRSFVSKEHARLVSLLQQPGPEKFKRSKIERI